MPNLLKLLARNLVMGIAAGWITLALLMVTNTSGLHDVVFGSSQPLLPLGLLLFGFTLTFGSVSMGAAIMMLPYEVDEGKDQGLKIPSLFARLKNMLPRFDKEPALVPIPIKDRPLRRKFPR